MLILLLGGKKKSVQYNKNVSQYIIQATLSLYLGTKIQLLIFSCKTTDFYYGILYTAVFFLP